MVVVRRERGNIVVVVVALVGECGLDFGICGLKDKWERESECGFMYV